MTEHTVRGDQEVQGDQEILGTSRPNRLVTDEATRIVDDFSFGDSQPTLTIPDADLVHIVFHRTQVNTSGQTLRMRLSDDNGSSFVSTNDYQWGYHQFDVRDPLTDADHETDDSDDAIGICNPASSSTNSYNPLTLSISNPTSGNPTWEWHGSHNVIRRVEGAGFLNQSFAVDSVQFHALDDVDGDVDLRRLWGHIEVSPGDEF